MAIFVILALGALVALWIASEPWRTERRRARHGAAPFPAAWRDILRRHVPVYRRLPDHLRVQLRRHVQVFIAEKSFVGCAGLAVTEAMRVVIAAQACLLLLNRRTDYFSGLRQVLVYPGPFVVNRLQLREGGVLQDHRHVLAGESWSRGQVILSWDDVVEGAAVDDDGRNVVIHEFAHQLDQENGEANGAPLLAHRDGYIRWSRVLGDEFERLRDACLRGEPTLLGEYAATAPAEFFAVASEIFFEQPQRMLELHEPLYRELAAFYKVDPAAW